MKTLILPTLKSFSYPLKTSYPHTNQHQLNQFTCDAGSIHICGAFSYSISSEFPSGILVAARAMPHRHNFFFLPFHFLALAAAFTPNTINCIHNIYTKSRLYSGAYSPPRAVDPISREKTRHTSCRCGFCIRCIPCRIRARATTMRWARTTRSGPTPRHREWSTVAATAAASVNRRIHLPNYTDAHAKHTPFVPFFLSSLGPPSALLLLLIHYSAAGIYTCNIYDRMKRAAIIRANRIYNYYTLY